MTRLFQKQIKDMRRDMERMEEDHSILIAAMLARFRRLEGGTSGEGGKDSSDTDTVLSFEHRIL